jgi:hypothetical protein
MTKNEITVLASIISASVNMGISLYYFARMKRRFDSVDSLLEKRGPNV